MSQSDYEASMRLGLRLWWCRVDGLTPFSLCAYLVWTKQQDWHGIIPITFNVLYQCFRFNLCFTGLCVFQLFVLFACLSEIYSDMSRQILFLTMQGCKLLLLGSLLPYFKRNDETFLHSFCPFLILWAKALMNWLAVRLSSATCEHLGVFYCVMPQ